MNLSKINELKDKALKVIIKNFNSYKLEYKGHNSNIKKEYLINELYFGLRWLKDHNLFLLSEGKKLPEPVEINLGAFQCSYCGQFLKYLFDGETLSIISSCEYPGGIKNSSIELNCPSGKMVFANDLRSWFKSHSSYNVNNDLGIVKTILAYANIGMAHGFVGNSCPGIYQIDDKNLSISATPCEENWDTQEQRYVTKYKKDLEKETPPGKLCGKISTELWWYSVVDYEDFRKRYLDSEGNLIEFKHYLNNNCKILTVEPGVYQVDHYLDETNKQADHPWHYATFKWLRSPEKYSFYEKYRKMNFTIGQCYVASIINHPRFYLLNYKDFPASLTMEERIKKLGQLPKETLENSVRKFYEHTFLSRHIQWHVNGWGSWQEVPENTPDFILPPLGIKYSWYYFDPTTAPICLAAEGKLKFNYSFLQAAYKMLHNILKFGIEESYKDLINLEDQLKLAANCLKGLAGHYPNTVPEYCQEFLVK